MFRFFVIFFNYLNDPSSCFAHYFSATWLVVIMGFCIMYNFFAAGKFHERKWDFIFVGILIAGAIVSTILTNCQLCFVIMLLQWSILLIGILVYIYIDIIRQKKRKK